MPQLTTGQTAPAFALNDADGHPVDLNQFKGSYTLISFFRYAGCPFCNLTMMQLIKRYDNFSKRGLKIVAFFQSPAATIQQYAAIKDPPFPLVPDPDKKIYQAYGVESSVAKSLASISIVPGVVKAVMQGTVTQGKVDGDVFLMPAQFIIGPDLTILKAFYGSNWGDKLSMLDIEEVLLTHPR